MNTSYLPPHPKSVEDLLSLLAVVTNPREVEKYTDGLLKAASEYREASSSFKDRDSELKASEDAVNAEFARYSARIAALSVREQEVQRQEIVIQDKLARVLEMETKLDDAKSALATQSDKLAHDKANFEQNRIATTANLIEWEANLKKDLDAHQHKVKALKELVAHG